MIGLRQTIRELAGEYSAAFGVPLDQLVLDAVLGTVGLLFGLANIVALVTMIGGGQ